MRGLGAKGVNYLKIIQEVSETNANIMCYRSRASIQSVPLTCQMVSVLHLNVSSDIPTVRIKARSTSSARACNGK
jgi:hypothetical protein